MISYTDNRNLVTVYADFQLKANTYTLQMST
jgi:hypothetical protein